MAAMSSKDTKKEKSLLEILHIVYRRKIIIIISVFLSLILAYLYNKFSTPVYESQALLKKEATQRERTDDLFELVKLQTMDQVGTVMALITTEDVLGRVIDELKLRVDLKKLIDPIGNSYKFKKVFIEFPDSGNSYAEQIGFSLPLFKNVEFKDKRTERELYIEKIGENLFELREVEENRVIFSTDASPVSVIDTTSDSYFTNNVDSIIALEKQSAGSIFNTDFAQFEFSWDDAPVGSKIYFNLNNYYKFLKGFSAGIFVTKGTGSLFRLHVRYSSPFACKVIAENVINRFRDARMEQQKQTVRYSFQFVDEQLIEVQKKLLDAEGNLSSFKASGQMMTIDASTAELISYLSTLESEKLNAEMLLSDFTNKSEAIREELLSSGYVDQSFLEPTDEFKGSSPFSNLMENLSDLEMQKLELLQKRTEKHPDVLNLNEQIRSVKDKLSSYNQNTLTSYQIIIKTLEKKLKKIESLISGYEVKMQKLPEQENSLARLVREKDVFEKIFKVLLDKREEMRVAELSKLQDIVVVDHPHEPPFPVKPKKMMNMLIGLFIGGFIGIVSVFLFELSKTRLVDLDYLEEELRIPILALIPKYDKSILKQIKNPADHKDKFVTLHDDNLGIRESYRLLDTKLNLLNIRDKTILVTSCEENTGKTSIVANLAITMALKNKNILLIDCDLRKADLSKMFDAYHDTPGLIDFIEKGDSPEIYTRVLKKINIIPAGGIRENSSILLSSDRMKSLFEVIDTSIYDFVIIDTPPVTRVVDTLAMGHSTKNSILVVRPDTSIKETVIGGIEELFHSRIKIRGVVANAAEIQKSYHYRYRYGYGYGYGNGENGKKTKKKKTKIVQTSV
ncbi:MAG: polysaccharide biosynthesis tyrosine autokinase [Ignavibacteriaceae bacterium]|nr:polysaccharide biosynthesis tyrosine autokinase [Ignavibacteria bacterium]MBT8391676.1 polysaccharide biosynthesis tyrosine autokinase [Ignavibacteria bacterium]NNL21164.1 polysaccharide biosynthesis tyrosine autokinase [Ignavibacteriaceae bacterium]